MPSFAPLRPGDPRRLAGLDLVGRLGEGGQGVVYLAGDTTGARLAVKWLRPDLSGDQVSVERFLREVQVAQRVAPFCTAAVLGTGIEQDRPYIVSEFIEGRSLQRVVQEDGPRTGSALHRLAIGTATALAAIHQAGIVHRDFKPANVILGADGPRVIDFGIARALNATSTISSMPVGTPAYMPPEQIMGHQVGPPADLFSWAGTIVFAASGHAPFGSDTMPAVINRVLNQPPDVRVLDGALRDVVLACLAKDPTQRPTAEQVIMRLLQHPVSGPPGGSAILAEAAAAAGPHAPGPHAGPPAGPHTPAGPHAGPHAGSHPGPHAGSHTGPPTGSHAPGYGPPSPGYGPPPDGYGRSPAYPPAGATRPGRSRKGPVVIGVSIAAALLILTGVTLVVAQDRPPATASRAKLTPVRTVSPGPSATPTPSRKRLAGGAITLFEHPSDPVTLTSYEIYDDKSEEWVDYARRSLRGTFAKNARTWESKLSPDGRYLATRGRTYTSDDYDSIVITDRKLGSTSSVKTVREPLISSIRAWSRDGSKILLNVEKMVKDKNGEDDWIYPGFVVVDVATATAEVRTVAGGSTRTTGFGWDPDEEGVVNVHGERGLRFFDADGTVTRTLTNVGTLPSGTQDVFSPSGELLATDCPPGGGGDHCLWDTGTGKKVRAFSSDCDKVLGWYDEKHLYCWERDNADKDEIQVVGFDGRLVRKLLECPRNVDFSPAYTVNPSGGS
ncbi:serine/threonine-protein kinase [Nonomuraea indica]|uniref:serine/threonine-protein kinase n=1 Tax=Nonomuraea indica TaxID=1581193 RepID=UPI000C7DD970|nr:serine/threonine-protein kinase [Nonomuraea indica]